MSTSPVEYSALTDDELDVCLIKTTELLITAEDAISDIQDRIDTYEDWIRQILTEIEKRK